LGAVNSILAEVGSAVLSLQPNQPGVLHVFGFVALVVLVVVADEAVSEVVVVSSKQPHQPGVLHVVVLVVVVEDIVD
jgi:hypothetical protein